MWFLSILFSVLGSATNLLFSLRYPSISITPVIALLLAHPLGLLWDSAFRDAAHGDGCAGDGNKPLGGAAMMWRRLRRWLGQGKWNEKEHCCVYISSNVSFGFAFATDVSYILLSEANAARAEKAKRTKGDCGTNTLLPPKPRSSVSDTPNLINPNFRIRICRVNEAVVSIS